MIGLGERSHVNFEGIGAVEGGSLASGWSGCRGWGVMVWFWEEAACRHWQWQEGCDEESGLELEFEVPVGWQGGVWL